MNDLNEEKKKECETIMKEIGDSFYKLSEEQKQGYRKALDDMEDAMMVMLDYNTLAREKINELRVNSYLGQEEETKNEE